jgi:cytochrome c553
MKKVMLVVLFALLAVGLAMAQPTAGNTNFTPSNDTLGAHNNGGRGCAGCHAPHSGGRGDGGNSVVNAGGIVSTGGIEGDQALWGTDVSLITQMTLGTGDAGKYVVNFGGAQQYTSTSGPLISGIAVCLSCHDGNVSKGAMMMNASYEQQWSLLPNGGGAHTYNGPLYGTTVQIPTLLGADNPANLGDYTNDHPIGPMANIAAVGSAALGNGLAYTVAGNKATWTTTGEYASFVNNYGDPQIKGLALDAVNQTPYVTCTTCHNQHIMNVYKVSSSTPIATLTTGAMATYFFINAPYNPGAPWTPFSAPSTTQFCRQCHFSHANEYYGVTVVGTAF